jgi:hypothetical protein
MPDYKTPNLKTILYETWDALKEFIYIAAPIVIISGVFIQAINLAGWMPAISSFLSPVTEKMAGPSCCYRNFTHFRYSQKRIDPRNAGSLSWNNKFY